MAFDFPLGIPQFEPVPSTTRPPNFMSLSLSTTLVTSIHSSTVTATIVNPVEYGSDSLGLFAPVPSTTSYESITYTSTFSPGETEANWSDIFGPVPSATTSTTTYTNYTAADPSDPTLYYPASSLKVCEIEHPSTNRWIEDLCVPRFRYHGALLWVVGFACLGIIAICGLLAGLTLAICGLDKTRLHIMSKTGKDEKADKDTRKMAKAILRMRKHETRLLCSMILFSVVCNESVPILLGNIYAQAWKCVLISTTLLAVFGELLPQAIVPRYALQMGYYCRSFIWATMILTLPLSYPTAWLFDRFFHPQPSRSKARKTIDDEGIYNHEQLRELLKYHERAENNHGPLGHVASRIARAALSVDFDTIGGGNDGLGEQFKRESRENHSFEKGEGSEKPTDLEKGEKNWTYHGAIYTPWALVKKVYLNEEVNDDFIRKVINWNYSRLPIVKLVSEDGSLEERVVGFLHIRNLVGLQIVSEMTVKDLKIYDMPKVFPDVPIFDMLNIFQTGSSHMAVVCARPFSANGVLPKFKPDNKLYLPMNQTAASPFQYNSRRNSETEARYTTDSLRKHFLGIVTYQDCVDSILNKTTWDEHEFHHKPSQNSNEKPSIPQESSSMRQRKVNFETAPSTFETAPTTGLDSADKRWMLGLDGANESRDFSTQMHDSFRTIERKHGSSSYTTNSDGGWHFKGRNGLQITSESGETVSLGPTSCCYSIRTTRPSMEVPPLFSSREVMEFQMPRILVDDRKNLPSQRRSASGPWWT